MKMESPPEIGMPRELTIAEELLQSSHGELEAFKTSLEPLRKALRCIQNLGDEKGQKAARRMMTKLDTLEPSITMIGQIKSGKTSLVNAMIGWPELLPADVNPWTSVVTSLHLSAAPLSPETSAKFRFFEDAEWERLTAGGGRIGELADRAGADEELSKIKAQVEEMREKSKARLGRKFEALLGQTHDYGYFDPELIARYVCLGDDFDDFTSASQGQFADITKSADLYFHQPALPMSLCIRDTPGVNDTFMMREQITIRSIRDSRLCVVVLAAHQALSSTDLALVRLITNVRSRDVIIFVNRIDELSDPGAQVPQIRESIQATLARHKGPEDAEIIFGSAIWAQTAMAPPAPALSDASKAALINWAKASKNQNIKGQNARGIMWQVSGLPALNAAIATRIADGVGRETANQIAISARNLINGIQLSDNLAAKAQIGETEVHLDSDQISEKLADLRHQSLATLRTDLMAVQADFATRLDRVHASFLDRATQALIHHLELYGEQEVWEYDPSGLRILLASSYKSFGRNSQLAFGRCMKQIIAEMTGLYHEALKLPEDLFDIAPPPDPRVPPPVSLGQTIALDLKGGWWKSWWFRRRGYQAFAADFHSMIQEETVAFLNDLKEQQALAFHETIVDQTDAFLREQANVLLSTAQTPTLGDDKIDALFGRQSLEERDAELQAAHALLDRYSI